MIRRQLVSHDDDIPSSTAVNWGGCCFGSENGPVTAISATFTIPTLTGQAGALMSVWVGMGNILQTGIYCSYNTADTGNNYLYGQSPFTWWLNGTNSAGSEIWDPNVYTLHAGDVMTLSMSYNDYWAVTQTNATRGWSYTEYKSFQSVGNAITAWPNPLNQGCVIIENENTNLPDYGTLTFSNISMTPAINTNYINYITTVNAHTDQTPGTFSNGSFTMTWNAAT